jgi:hypothetical protein
MIEDYKYYRDKINFMLLVITEIEKLPLSSDMQFKVIKVLLEMVLKDKAEESNNEQI